MIKKNYDEDFEINHLETNLKDHSIKSGSIVVFSRLLNYFIQMFSTIIMARILTPSDFGLVAMVYTLTGFLLIFQDLGLTDATIQQPKINQKQVSTLFWINILFCFLFTIIIILLSPALAWFYKDKRLINITIVSSLNFIFIGLSVQHIALLKRKMSFFALSIIEIISTIISIVSIIILAIIGWGYWSIVMRPIIFNIVRTLIVWIYYKWIPALPSFHSGIKSMLKFGVNSIGYFFINYFARNFDKAVIGWKFGAKDLGLYDKSFSLFILPISQITIPLHHVVVAALSKLKNDQEKYKRYYLKALDILCFIGFPLCFFMTSISNDLIKFLLGEQWTQASKIFFILGLGASMQLIYSTVGWLSASLGRADRWFYWGIIGSSLTIIAIIIGLFFGIYGIAISYSAILYLITFPGLLYSGKPVNLKFTELLSVLWRYFISSVIAGAFCIFVDKFVYLPYLHIIRIIIFTFIYFIIYFLFLLLLYMSLKPFQTINYIFSKLLLKFFKKNG